MIEVLLICPSCTDEIAVDVDRAILRTDVEPRARAELLFCCPRCDEPGLRPVGSELLALLLLVGVEPMRLSEPTLPPEDRGPDLPGLTPEDLLSWHEQLAAVDDVSPWES